MGGRLSDVRKALPQVINTPELRFDCDDVRKFEVVKEVAARLKAAGANVSETDGVRVMTADGWLLLRSSNTQAVLGGTLRGRLGGGAGPAEGGAGGAVGGFGSGGAEFFGGECGALGGGGLACCPDNRGALNSLAAISVGNHD